MSNLAQWTIIETFDTEVADEILAVLKKESEDSGGYIYKLMWGDYFWFHGEDGWCLFDSTLDKITPWLEELRQKHGLSETECFWVRVKMS